VNTPPIVSPKEWDAARQKLLVKEKELTRARDALAARPRSSGRPLRRVTRDPGVGFAYGPERLRQHRDRARQAILQPCRRR
jgi:predicted dithiol-disulfide oxidoreductase (DUF899 family)